MLKFNIIIRSKHDQILIFGKKITHEPLDICKEQDEATNSSSTECINTDKKLSNSSLFTIMKMRI